MERLTKRERKNIVVYKRGRERKKEVASEKEGKNMVVFERDRARKTEKEYDSV